MTTNCVSVHGTYIALEPSLDGKEPTAFKAVVLSNNGQKNSLILFAPAWCFLNLPPKNHVIRDLRMETVNKHTVCYGCVMSLSFMARTP